VLKRVFTLFHPVLNAGTNLAAPDWPDTCIFAFGVWVRGGVVFSSFNLSPLDARATAATLCRPFSFPLQSKQFIADEIREAVPHGCRLG
jgi:hypothetical protein